MKLLSEEELKEWAINVSGIKHVLVKYIWNQKPIDYMEEASPDPSLNQIIIRINGNAMLYYDESEEKQRSYLLHELGHYFEHPNFSDGAREFEAQLWAIKKTYYAGMLSLNQWARYFLEQFQGPCKVNENDYRYDKAFKIAKKLKII